MGAVFLFKSRSFSPSDRGASIVEALLLMGLISLLALGAMRFFSRSIQTRAIHTACMFEIQGGGTTGIMGDDEREGTAPSTDGEEVVESALVQCMRAKEASVVSADPSTGTGE